MSRTFTILADPARRCKARWLAARRTDRRIRPPCVDLDRWCIVVVVNVLDIVCRVSFSGRGCNGGPFEVTQDSVRVTIGDVAERAGVSIATVSRVVNGRYGVAPTTLSRVRAVIDNLGYESSHAARSLRSQRTGVIGTR